MGGGRPEKRREGWVGDDVIKKIKNKKIKNKKIKNKKIKNKKIKNKKIKK